MVHGAHLSGMVQIPVKCTRYPDRRRAEVLWRAIGKRRTPAVPPEDTIGYVVTGGLNAGTLNMTISNI